MSISAGPSTSPGHTVSPGQPLRSPGEFKSPSIPLRRASFTSPPASTSAIASAGQADPSIAPLAGPSQDTFDVPAKSKARTSRACSSCNRQKLRCDGGRPCSRCVALKAEDACEYLPSLRGKTRKRKEKTSDKRDGRDKRVRVGSQSPGRSRSEERHKRGLEDNEEFQRWKRDTALAVTGARNSTLWGPEPSPSLSKRPPSFSHSSPGSHPRFDSMSVERRGTNPMTIDKLTTLPLPGDAHNPLAVLAEASATANPDSGGSPTDIVSVVGTAGTGRTNGPGEKEEGGYYAPLDRTLKDEAPHIMSLINVHEAERLFEMYFRYLHPYAPFLDREHSVPSTVARRNNFLFNAICCVAARAFDVVLWARLQEFAKFEMERLPKEKNIDVVQGHLIYTEWNLIRPKHFEQDMSWLRVGVAVRTAIDINLHRVALLKQARDGLPSWVVRSIIRTWLLSYIIDRTLSAQLGKPSSMRGENSVRMYVALIMDGEDKPTADDIWVAALAEWTQILARALDTFRSSHGPHYRQPTFLLHLDTANESTFPDLVHVFSKQFQQWRERSEALANGDEKGTRFMVANIRLYEGYALLVVQSFALQRAVDNAIDLPAAFAQYQIAATKLIATFESDLESTSLTRGCPDKLFTILTYGAVSLLKALQPQFAHLEPNRPSILSTARQAADMLARAAMTPDHLPASQSAFISRLIDVKSNEAAQPSLDAGQRLGVTPWIPETINFEALGQAIDANQTTALWPPMPSPGAANGWANIFGQATETSHIGEQQQNGVGLAGVEGPGNPFNAAREAGATQTPTDLSSWVAQVAYQGTVPGAGAALGLGGLGVGGWGDGDLLFTQDSFWKSILEGTQHPAPSMV